MILFLRTDKNETVLDLEVWIKTEESISFVELGCVIDIENYSLLLLKTTDEQKQIEMIAEFSELSELRGWLHEVFFMAKKNTEKEFDNVLKQLKKILNETADKYGLFLVTD